MLWPPEGHQAYFCFVCLFDLLVLYYDFDYFVQGFFLTRILNNKIFKNWVFPYSWPWLPELAMFDLKIGFLIKKCIYVTPGMYGKPPKKMCVHGFSKAGFGHAFLFLESSC